MFNYLLLYSTLFAQLFASLSRSVQVLRRRPLPDWDRIVSLHIAGFLQWHLAFSRLGGMA
jgi:hypothetical protein